MKTPLPIILAVVAVATSTVTAETLVGINFAGRQWSIGGNTPQTLAGTDTAGFVAQQNWNNVDPGGADSGGLAQIVSPNGGVLTESQGNVVNWSFSYVAGGMWSVNQSTTQTGNTQLVNGYLDTSDLGTVTINLDNIDLTLYTVYVYMSSDTSGRLGSISNGATTKFFLTDTNPFNGFTEATATTAGEATAANVAIFSGLTASSLQLVLTEVGGSNVGVAAIQIVGVPEPGTVATLAMGIGALVLIFRRRLQKTC